MGDGEFRDAPVGRTKDDRSWPLVAHKTEGLLVRNWESFRHGASGADHPCLKFKLIHYMPKRADAILAGSGHMSAMDQEILKPEAQRVAAARRSVRWAAFWRRRQWWPRCRRVRRARIPQDRQSLGLRRFHDRPRPRFRPPPPGSFPPGFADEAQREPLLSLTATPVHSSLHSRRHEWGEEC
jgi:hypothetical protein